MNQRFCGGNVAAVDQSLNEGVVFGDLAHFTVASQINSRVTDVRNHGFVVGEDHAGKSRTHTGEGIVLVYGFAKLRIGLEHCPEQRSGGILGGCIESVNLRNVLSHHRTCDVSAGVATHTVGDKVKLIAGVTAILVARTHAANVTDRVGYELVLHRLGSQLKNSFANLHRCVELHNRGGSDARSREEGSVG